MKRLLIAVAIYFIVWPAYAQNTTKICIPVGTGNSCQNITAAFPMPVTGTISAASAATATAAAPSYIEGTSNPFSQNLTGDLRVIAKQSGTWTITGTGGTFPVTQSTSPWVVSNGGTFAVQSAQSGTWTVQPGNTANTTAWLVTGAGGTFPVTGTFWQATQPVSNAGTFAVQATLPTSPAIASGSGVIHAPSSAAAAGMANVVSTAAESNHVLKGSAGNLYTLTTTIGATSGYLMLFDATSLPANGAVTPKYCLPVTSNATNGGATLAWPYPLVFATGITAGFSITGCFTLTASATANFFGQIN